MLPDIVYGEVDGLPIFSAASPGSFSALLVFRVGRADETLSRAGITHLVEHLAMPLDEPLGVDVNAYVDQLSAVFFASGSPEGALGFVKRVTTALSSLPVERLATERRILLAEAAGVIPGPVEAALALRYGPRGHGLVGYEELGLHAVTEEDVTAWAAERLGRASAALCITGPPPDELELELTDGRRLAPPRPESIPYLQLPAGYAAGSGGACWTAVGERTAALNVALSAAEARLRRRLRHEQGVSYGAGGSYEALTADRAHIVLGADSLPANAALVRDAIVAVAEEVASDGPTEEELEREVARFAAAGPIPPEELRGWLVHQAVDDLLGRPRETPAQLADERAAVTRTEAARAFAAAAESGLLVVPEGVSLPHRRFRRYPASSPTRVEGRAYRIHGLRLTRVSRAIKLIVGDDGISLVDDAQDRAITVRFADCAAVVERADGALDIWSGDGFLLPFEQGDWSGGGDVVATLRKRIGPERWVRVADELAGAAGAVEEVAARKLRRRWLVSEELAELPALLEPHEEVQNLCEATVGMRAGLLVLTDRRLLFVYKGLRASGDTLVELPRDVVEHAALHRGLLRGWKLDVRTEDGEHSFTEISPKERASEFEEALLGAARQS